MSFAAVLALVSGYEALRPALSLLHGEQWWRRPLSHVVALVLTSLLAGTASAPYGAYHFGHIQLYFIAANVIAVPLTAMWVMPLGLIGLALMPLGLEQVALVPMGWGVQAILSIGRTVSAWPEATLAVPPMPAWGLAVFSLGLAWLGIWRSRWRLLGVAPMLAGLLSPLAAPPPDVLVSNDARLIAMREEGAYWLQSRPGAAKFVHEAWENHLASGELLPVADGAPRACGPTECRLGPVLILRGSSRAGDCTGVGLLVSAEPARGECPSAGLLDRFTVWRDGSHAVWLDGNGVRVVSDRAYRGQRPWVPPPPTPRRVVPNLPMAPAEELPPASDE
jgi:competence protein ComEC